MPSMPPAEAPARCARKIGTRGRTQGDEMESTPARKAAMMETSMPMRQPYHRRLGAAIDPIVHANGLAMTPMTQPRDQRNKTARRPAALPELQSDFIAAKPSSSVG